MTYISSFKANEAMLVPASSTGFYSKEGREITRAAFFALKAARMVKQIGHCAARSYCLNNGSSLALFRLAQQLQAANKFDRVGQV